jgi:hypothetical protein
MAAAKDALQKLHEVLAQTLADAITEGVPVKDDETGEVTKAPAPAAILNVARQFLKDNNIEAVAVPGKPLASLASKLPFAGSEEMQDKDDNYTAH